MSCYLKAPAKLNLTYRFFCEIIMSEQIVPVLAESFRYSLILLVTSGEIFDSLFRPFLKLNTKKIMPSPTPPQKGTAIAQDLLVNYETSQI